MKCKLLAFNEKNIDLIYRTGDTFYRYNPTCMINPIEISREDAIYLSSVANENVDIVMDDIENFMAIIEKYALDYRKNRKDKTDPELMSTDQIYWWFGEVNDKDLIEHEPEKVGSFVRELLEFNPNVQSDFHLRGECQNLLTVAEYNHG